MSWRRAIVKDAQLFKYNYASAILERPGHHVVGCVLTCEMSDETVIGNSSWGKIKETAVDFEKNGAIQNKILTENGEDGLTQLCELINAQNTQNDMEPLRRQPFDDSATMFMEKL